MQTSILIASHMKTQAHLRSYKPISEDYTASTARQDLLFPPAKTLNAHSSKIARIPPRDPSPQNILPPTRPRPFNSIVTNYNMTITITFPITIQRGRVITPVSCDRGGNIGPRRLKGIRTYPCNLNTSCPINRVLFVKSPPIVWQAQTPRPLRKSAH